MTYNEIVAIADQAMVGNDDPRINITELGTKYHVFMALLAKAMKAKRIVELGTYIGETSKQIGLMCPDAEVWTIDVNPDAKVQIEQVTPVVPNVKAFTHNAEYFVVDGRYDNVPIDLLFIDSNHDFSHTMGNFNAWKDLVRPGGIIAFDDWTLDNEMIKVRDYFMSGTDVGFDYIIVEVNKVHATGFAILLKSPLG